MKHAHNLIIYLRKNDFDRLMGLRQSSGAHLITPGIQLEDAWLEFTDTVARLHILYRGNRPDGTAHRRRTRDVINFLPGFEGVVWLYRILPDPEDYQAARPYWPGGWEENSS